MEKQIPIYATEDAEAMAHVTMSCESERLVFMEHKARVDRSHGHNYDAVKDFGRSEKRMNKLLEKLFTLLPVEKPDEHS